MEFRTQIIGLVFLAAYTFTIWTLAGQPGWGEDEIPSAKAETTIADQRNRANDLVAALFKTDIDQTFTTFSTPVTVTAYSARAEECDETPWVTADGTPSRIGLLAVSRDILTEVGLEMGQRVFLPEYGLFEIRDKMNRRFRRRVDILHASPEAARRFGKRTTVIIWIRS